MIAVRAYRTLLRFYPSDYTALFAAEMARAFQRAAEEQRARGRGVIVRFALRELIGLVVGAAAEWAAKLTTDRSIRGRCLPDLRMMRPTGVPQALWFAGASAAAGNSSLPRELAEAQNRTDFLVNCMVYAISHHQFEKARFYSNEERKARENLRRLREKYNLAE